MLNVIGVGLGVALAVAMGWLARRRRSVVDYHQIDTEGNRVGGVWLSERHGGR